MIRRITRNNDYKDIIKSCPVGVIDYVYRVDYYVSGHPEVFVEMTPVKVGEHLEVVLSTEALENLTYNGVLMRRAYYSQADSEYPDDSYDLEFVDNMNVWLGEEDTVAPFDPGYLTEDDLKTINGESIVGEGNLEIEAVIPDYYATKSWVSDQGYLKSVPSGYATKSWVSSQQFATQSWVSEQNYTSMEGVMQYLDAYAYATEEWVRGQDYISSIPSEYVTQSWLSSHSYMTEDDVRWILAGEGEDNPVVREDYMGWFVPDQVSRALSGYATESWVQSQGYITSTGVSGLATMSWVEAQGYITSTGVSGLATMSWVEAQGYITSETLPENIATQSWVSSNFLSATALTGYATESWVSAQGYLTSETIPSDIATQSWVLSQSYITSTALNGYATESWVSSQFFETSKIWTGTSSQWAELTPEQQAFYTIALVTE